MVSGSNPDERANDGQVKVVVCRPLFSTKDVQDLMLVALK